MDSLADAIARVHPSTADLVAPHPLGRLDLTNPARETRDSDDDDWNDDDDDDAREGRR